MQLFIEFNVPILFLIAFCFFTCHVSGFSVVKVKRSTTTVPVEVFTTTSSPTEAPTFTTAGLEDEEEYTTRVWEMPPNRDTGLQYLIEQYFIKLNYVWERQTGRIII